MTCRQRSTTGACTYSVTGARNKPNGPTRTRSGSGSGTSWRPIYNPTKPKFRKGKTNSYDSDIGYNRTYN